MKIETVDLLICPICHGQVAEFYCASCKAVTILPWELVREEDEEALAD